ncbi:hypothetical protein HK097_009482 [Rhizophlyctis rosea]|uniref:Formyl transferase N-terminal domain-containing protein n=1 Tax=Rhizophlyctis rosea TaxID=64517 RepID=A0AAD5SKT6_9FUNG|nr:hypothetical protein HK097_009482 [Rhizophlyctis rosea]
MAATTKPSTPTPLPSTVTLLIVCPDQVGIVASLTSFVVKYGGNLRDVDFHTDHEEGLFLGRLEWGLDKFTLSRSDIRPAIDGLCSPLGGRYELHFSDQKQRVALFVSLQDHCMLDLLWRDRLSDVNAEVALVISNHETLRGEVEHYGIPFHVFKITKANKYEQEQAELALLKEQKIDLVVMAKYMQIISDSFLRSFPNAHARGVKLIGATAHFATPELDAGPIIEQEVVRVSHRDTVDDLVRKGKDVERVVLGRAVRLHLLHRVLTYGNKTVVFE